MRKKIENFVFAVAILLLVIAAALTNLWTQGPRKEERKDPPVVVIVPQPTPAPPQHGEPQLHRL